MSEASSSARCMWMRGGTSKGGYFLRDDLPADTPAQEAHWLSLDNSADAHAAAIQSLEGISLHFPKFSDGRAFSQAVILRRRGFTGERRQRADVAADGGGRRSGKR